MIRTFTGSAYIAGSRREWDAEIVAQHPEQRIAWQSTSGARNAGIVEFRPIGQNRTEIMLQLDFEPEGGTVEKVGDKMGFVQRRVEADLEGFREFLQSRSGETGAWRGDVHGGQVTPSTTGTTGAMPADHARRDQA